LAFADRVLARVPARTRQHHLLSLLAPLSELSPADDTNLYGILQDAVDSYPRRSVMVLVSDLLVERSGLVSGLRLLRQHGHEVIVLHVLDDDELDFSFSGPLRFEGLEGDALLNCNPRALRDGYLAALSDYLDEVRVACARHSVDYHLVRTSQPLDQPLVALLTKRLARHSM
jgi:uncharacterized protein (DUF58 family)